MRLNVPHQEIFGSLKSSMDRFGFSELCTNLLNKESYSDSITEADGELN
jgi:hypothetical protein